MATAAQIRAEIEAGPRTQDALNQAFMKYTPAQLQAAFPEHGNVEQYNRAASKAYADLEQQQQAANRAAVLADMAARGEEIRISNPGGDVQRSGPARPTMSAIPQSEIDAARAKLTPAQREFIDWKIEQMDPMQHTLIKDQFARAGANPYLDAAGAQAEIDRASNRQALFEQAGVTPEANLAPWQDPQWREKLKVEQDARAAAQEEARRNPGLFTVGPVVGPVVGPTPTTVTPGRVTPGRGDDGFGITTLITPTPTTSTPTTSITTPATTGTTPAKFNPARIQAIQQWYNSNAGRTDPQAKGDLTRFLATSGYTFGEINAALPQWGLTDLDKAIQGAQKEFKPSSKDIISTNTMPTVATGDYSGANLNVSNFGRTPFTDDLFSYFKNQSPFYYQDRPDSVERVGAIRDFYAANDGRTDPQAQSDLNRFLASGYTAREFKTALPQFPQSDLEKAIGAAYKEFPRSENSSNASPTAGAAQGLAALYASLNANLFDANSQTAQGAGNTGNTGIAGLS